MKSLSAGLMSHTFECFRLQRNSRSYSDPPSEALGADRIKRLQQHRPQQLFRRDRRPPNRRIERGKLARQRRQRHLQSDGPPEADDHAPHPRLQFNVAEQFARSIVATAHSPSPNLVGVNESRSPVGGERLFQQPARSRICVFPQHISVCCSERRSGARPCRNLRNVRWPVPSTKRPRIRGAS